MPNAGEKPGKGKYICTQCGNDVNLDDDDDKLPPCSQCNNGSYH